MNVSLSNMEELLLLFSFLCDLKRERTRWRERERERKRKRVKEGDMRVGEGCKIEMEVICERKMKNEKERI